ncbi:hypothetical protein [Tritonibacter aquimaris]|uniref:hypothetical protein n=1 Tax=Tritonibacter aquimaris TaxID=2663379 RepID=UPI0018864944|nr:hypothetical protein [Tritonibacter aquimaris]
MATTIQRLPMRLARAEALCALSQTEEDMKKPNRSKMDHIAELTENSGGAQCRFAIKEITGL